MSSLEQIDMANATHPPRVSQGARLEKIATAASRMAVSIPQVYREAKAGRLTIIKLGPRASALESGQVDAWIGSRIAEAQQRTAKRQGGTK